MLMDISAGADFAYNPCNFGKFHRSPDFLDRPFIRRLHADLELDQSRAHRADQTDLFFIEKIRRHLKMKISRSVVMFREIFPDRHRMIVAAVERPVHKLHLRYFSVNKKLQFPLHKLRITEPQTFVDRRETVTAGKRASPAGFIIDDLMLKRIHILVDERNFA